MIHLYTRQGEYSMSLNLLDSYIQLHHPNVQTCHTHDLNMLINLHTDDILSFHAPFNEDENHLIYNNKLKCIHHLDLFQLLHNKLEYINLNVDDLINLYYMLNGKDEQARKLAKKTITMIPVDYLPFFYSRCPEVNVHGIYTFNFMHQLCNREIRKRKYSNSKHINDTTRIKILLELFPNKTDIVLTAIKKVASNEHIHR